MKGKFFMILAALAFVTISVSAQNTNTAGKKADVKMAVKEARKTDASQAKKDVKEWNDTKKEAKKCECNPCKCDPCKCADPAKSKMKEGEKEMKRKEMMAKDSLKMKKEEMKKKEMK